MVVLKLDEDTLLLTNEKNKKAAQVFKFNAQTNEFIADGTILDMTTLRRSIRSAGIDKPGDEYFMTDEGTIKRNEPKA